MSAPLVSVILPFYNAAQTLARAIQSIYQQEYVKFECLMIDNGTTDGSLEIAEGWCRRDKRFVLLHELNRGVVHASNLGVANARGSFIARMDADDVSRRNRLALQVAWMLKYPTCDGVGGLAKYVTDGEQGPGLERYVDWSNALIDEEDIKLKRFIESPVINPTAMWRSEAFKRFGAWREGDFPEDYELWLRWMSKGANIMKIPRTLIDWHDSPTRLTRTDKRYATNAFYRIKSHYLAKWLAHYNPHHPEVYVWGASKISRKRAAYLTEHDIVIKSYVDIHEKRQLNKPLLYFEDLPGPGAAFVLVYMGLSEARTAIVEFLSQKKFIEGQHYLLIA